METCASCRRPLVDPAESELTWELDPSTGAVSQWAFLHTRCLGPRHVNHATVTHIFDGRVLEYAAKLGIGCWLGEVLPRLRVIRNAGDEF